MYLRMLRRDIKDKPGLNVVTFVFMIAAVMFMVIGSTLLYSLFGGEQKTYDRCNSSDVYFLLDKSISDADGNRKSSSVPWMRSRSSEIIYMVRRYSKVLPASRCRARRRMRFTILPVF